jgi:glycerol-1-phosphate dehydrogenase [NAD(P)+]
MNSAAFKADDGCGRHHHVLLQSAVIAPDALLGFEDVLRTCGFDGDYAVVYDENTYEALRGKRPRAKQEVILPPEGLHANEHGVELAKAKLGDARLLVAAGAGTVHDITRYICAERGVPFASVPTAASVDGFVSSVAAMTLGGFKVTVPSAAPEFLVADLDVIAEAPAYLAASGLGDVLGKYVSLTDWAIAKAVTGEYHCAYTAALMKQAVDEAAASVEGIAAGERAAFGSLMKALVLSGVAMQLTGNSRPASGAEHHISHCIELGPPWLPAVDALHGEKVGVGTVLALKKYRSWIGAKPDELVRAVAAWKPYTEAQLTPVFGHLTESVLKENAACCLEAVAPEKLAEQWETVQALLASLPGEDTVAALLAHVGGKTTLGDLGIDEAQRDKLLTWSPTVRNRLTFMRLLQTLNL